ncbi:hypothetical protein Y032_0473g2093 [Ancylostoma ceylanicum]|uniref:Uncharacterized protein n=1 Tax=Ancylostoma ceylanicum TaxID=53326 RepID=A0A016WW95_9BILA|nr:hypothetical protein Y032_0473g2093 [Ancylostoma ceylanicum]
MMWGLWRADTLPLKPQLHSRRSGSRCRRRSGLSFICLTQQTVTLRSDYHDFKRLNPSLTGRVYRKNTLAQNDLEDFPGPTKLSFRLDGTTT